MWGCSRQSSRSQGRPWAQALSPVRLVQLHDPLLQLSGLVRGEAELTDVVAHMLLGIVVAQLGLHGVGAQQGVRDEGAGQPACDDVCPQLQAQVISGDRGEWAWARCLSRPRCPLSQPNQPQHPSAQWKRNDPRHAFHVLIFWVCPMRWFCAISYFKHFCARLDLKDCSYCESIFDF